jgi:hypothetical protein
MNLEDLAKRIREACLEAIVQAYEDAGMQGYAPMAGGKSL